MVEELETPCLLIDRRKLLANLGRVQTIAQQAGVALRPHVKTHKSLELARLQLAGGACGMTASKVDEAIVFLQGGAPSVTLAYPVLDPRKLDRLLRAAAAHGAELNLIVDSLPLVEAAEDASRRAGRRTPVFLKVDVGLGRVGVDPKSKAAVAVARAVAASSHLTFAGLLSHAGHAYAAAGSADIAAIAEVERLTMLTLRDRLKAEGVEAPAISVGSTPTVLAARNFEGVTEIRPGNYVFLDGTAARLGLARAEEAALTVSVTVLSRNDRYLIVDAGSKVLSSDTGAHGTGGGGYGRAYHSGRTGDGWDVARLSEEHGWIAHDGQPVPTGTRLEILPNHACPVANLVGRAWLVEDGRVLDEWRLQAQAQVL